MNDPARERKITLILFFAIIGVSLIFALVSMWLNSPEPVTVAPGPMQTTLLTLMPLL